jgi:glycosyltransferase involved in cell wall biosynthesis
MRIRVAVCIAVYNEEANIENLFHSLITQTRMADEIVIVDDGSKDSTPELLKILEVRFQGKNDLKFLLQANRGPAAARNSAWRHSNSDICVFTDGDCKPDKDWLEKLITPLEMDSSLIGAGGAYARPDSPHILSRFIGFEIL